MNEQLLQETLAAIKSDMSNQAGSLFLELIADYLGSAMNTDKRVSTALTPDQLSERFNSPLPKKGQPLTEVVKQLAQEIIPDVTRLIDPRYMAVPVAPPLPATIWTESLIGALNQSNRVFDLSPTGTTVEVRLVQWLAEQIGFGPQAGGTFTSGGTEANFTGLLAARAATLPHAWHKGVGDNPPVVLCAENSHYTVFRAVAELGLGSQQAVSLPLRNWRMDTDALEKRLRELAQSKQKVMAVVATVGAFGVGAFDDLSTIGDICQAYGVWLHVDGAHGASALLSQEHRYRLRGLEKANSVVWDPHKMMLMPLSASVLLVKNEADLVNAFTSEPSESVNPQLKWNLGTRSFMASRRSDALKIWVALQRYGTDGLGALYAHLCHLTQILYELINERNEFESFHVPECNILCFRYVGNNSLASTELNQLNRQLFTNFESSGRGFIASYINEARFLLRVTLMNPLTEVDHLRQMLDDLNQLGQQLYPLVRQNLTQENC